MDSYIQDRYNSNSLGVPDDQGGFDSKQYERQRQVQKYPPQMPSQISQMSIRDRMHQMRMLRNPGGVNTGVRSQRKVSRGAVLKQWNDKCQIQNVSLPQIISSPNCSQRFRVTLTWLDQQGRPHKQDINFGQQGKQQFIDHHDTTIRDARLAQIKQQTLINPLHPNFWKFHLLNKYTDINIAYFKFVQENSLTGKRLVLKKQFRKNSGVQSAKNARSKLAGSIPSSIKNISQNDLMRELQQNYRYVKH